MPAPNERFGATAAGSADLKGSAGKPPLRQAAIPLHASRRQRTGQSRKIEHFRQQGKTCEAVRTGIKFNQMSQDFTQITHFGAMEAETISKNGAKPKSLMSRRNTKKINR